MGEITESLRALKRKYVSEQSLRVYGLTPFPVSSLCFILVVEDEITQLPALAPITTGTPVIYGHSL